MKRLLSLLAFSLLLPALANAQQVTFTAQAFPEGTTRAVVDSMELVFLISVNAEGADQPFDVTQAFRRSYDETILATSGGDITRRKVTFKDAGERGNRPMQGVRSKTYSISGKTYILETGGDSLIISGEDGAEVTKAERDEIRGVFSGGGEKQFTGILKDRTMSVGEEIELTPEMLFEFGEGLPGGVLKPQSGRMKLVDVHEAQGMSAALLELEVKMAGSQGMMELEFSLKGTVEVGVENLWPMSVVMKGTVAGVGNHAGMDMSADGDLRMARIVTYE